jgi:hypothetical protein
VLRVELDHVCCRAIPPGRDQTPAEVAVALQIVGDEHVLGFAGVDECAHHSKFAFGLKACGVELR